MVAGFIVAGMAAVAVMAMQMLELTLPFSPPLTLDVSPNQALSPAVFGTSPAAFAGWTLLGVWGLGVGPLVQRSHRVISRIGLLASILLVGSFECLITGLMIPC